MLYLTSGQEDRDFEDRMVSGRDWMRVVVSSEKRDRWEQFAPSEQQGRWELFASFAEQVQVEWNVVVALLAYSEVVPVMDREIEVLA
jgi:hypothetical protein